MRRDWEKYFTGCSEIPKELLPISISQPEKSSKKIELLWGAHGKEKTACHVTKAAAALDELGITGKSATCLPAICGTERAPR